MTDLFPVVIHHNPACGTSRNVVEIVRQAGYAPTIVEYLDTGWTRPQLLALFAAAGLTPRAALRETKSPAAELGLLAPEVSDDSTARCHARAPRAGEPAHRRHPKGRQAVPAIGGGSGPARPPAAGAACQGRR